MTNGTHANVEASTPTPAVASNLNLGPEKPWVAFLTRVVPWPQPGHSGVVNLHWKSHDAKTGKTFWGGRPQTSVDDFVSLANWTKSRPNIQDLYFCLSMQSETGPYRNGKPT